MVQRLPAMYMVYTPVLTIWYLSVLCTYMLWHDMIGMMPCLAAKEAQLQRSIADSSNQ